MRYRAPLPHGSERGAFEALRETFARARIASAIVTSRRPRGACALRPECRGKAGGDGPVKFGPRITRLRLARKPRPSARRFARSRVSESGSLTDVAQGRSGIREVEKRGRRGPPPWNVPPFCPDIISRIPSRTRCVGSRELFEYARPVSGSCVPLRRGHASHVSRGRHVTSVT
jgi:hypothetical protein